MVTGVFVSGSVPFHARRSSAKAGGVRAGVVSVNVAGSSDAAAKSGRQSVVPVRGGDESTWGGTAANEMSRPLVSIARRVEPAIVSGGSSRSFDVERVLRNDRDRARAVPEQHGGRTSVRQLAPVSLAASVVVAPLQIAGRA